MGHGHAPGTSERHTGSRRRLAIVLALVGGYTVVSNRSAGGGLDPVNSPLRDRHGIAHATIRPEPVQYYPDPEHW